MHGATTQKTSIFGPAALKTTNSTSEIERVVDRPQLYSGGTRFKS